MTKQSHNHMGLPRRPTNDGTPRNDWSVSGILFLSMVLKLNSKQLRVIDAEAVSPEARSVVRNPLVFILENIYDTYNIGGLFRLADALAASKVYLCGDTATPPNHRIHKASCGTYKVVPWEYCKTAKEAVEKYKENSQFSPTTGRAIFNKNPSWGKVSAILRQAQDDTADGRGKCVIAIEQSPTSIPYTALKPSFPLALVVGNETTGITPETLALCDKTVEIPMWGINKSLNVIASAAIVSYHLMTKTNSSR